MKASVVVRSYNRLPALCELLDVLLAQEFDDFEIVVVEQSTKGTDAEKAELAKREADPRVRVLRSGPLGGAKARNVGVEAARGEIVLFMDDDDLVLGTRWIQQHLKNYDDPNCLGVSGRQVGNADGSDPGYRDAERAYRRCQMFSPLLKLPWTYCRQTRRKLPVDCLIGGNGSMRRSCYERFGGWDTDTNIEDEASFGYRAGRKKKPEEYFVFDPEPVIWRRQDVPGGLAKRFTSAGMWFERMMKFVNKIVRRYFPARVVVLYPLYVLAVYGWTLSFLWDESNDYKTTGRRVLAAVGLFFSLPWRVFRLWAVILLVACASHHPAKKLPDDQACAKGDAAACLRVGDGAMETADENLARAAYAKACDRKLGEGCDRLGQMETAAPTRAGLFTEGCDLGYEPACEDLLAQSPAAGTPEAIARARAAHGKTITWPDGGVWTLDHCRDARCKDAFARWAKCQEMTDTLDRIDCEHGVRTAP